MILADRLNNLSFVNIKQIPRIESRNVCKIAASLFNFYKPAAWSLAVGINGANSISQTQKLFTSLTAYQWKVSCKELLALSVSISTLAAYLFNHRIGSIISISYEIIQDLNKISNCFINGQYKKGLKAGVTAVQHTLSLFSITSTNPLLPMISSALQLAIDSHKAWKRGKEQKWVESAAWLMIAGLRGFQIHQQVEELKYSSIEFPEAQKITDEEVCLLLREFHEYKESFKNEMVNFGTFLKSKGFSTHLEGIDFSFAFSKLNYDKIFSNTLFSELAFTDCHFTGIPFISTIFNNCKFVDCQFNYTLFLKAKINAVDFIKCELYNTIFMQSSILNSIFFDCNLESIRSVNVKYFKSHFYNVTFDNVTSMLSTYKNCIFKKINFTFSYFKEDVFNYVKFLDCDFSHSIFNRTEFNCTKFKNLFAKSNQFHSSIWKECQILKSFFLDCNYLGSLWKDCQSIRSAYQDCLFPYSELKRTQFVKTNLFGSDFYQADLTYCIFKRCKLEGASFLQARVNLSSIIGSNLTDCLLFDNQSAFHLKSCSENVITRPIIGLTVNYRIQGTTVPLVHKAIREEGGIPLRLDGPRGIEFFSLGKQVQKSIYDAKTKEEIYSIAAEVIKQESYCEIKKIKMHALNLARYVNGIVIPGGSDIEPELYGQVKIEKTNSSTDGASFTLFQLSLLEYAHKTKLPIFGICRGAQVGAIYHGAKLHQDVPNQWDIQTYHIRRTSQLSSIIGNKIDGKSMHHQGIYDPGKTLIPTIFHDGIIKALEHPDGNLFLFQFHPEMSYSDPMPPISENNNKIFPLLIRLATQHKEKTKKYAVDYSVATLAE